MSESNVNESTQQPVTQGTAAPLSPRSPHHRRRQAAQEVPSVVSGLTQQSVVATAPTSNMPQPSVSPMQVHPNHPTPVMSPTAVLPPLPQMMATVPQPPAAVTPQPSFSQDVAAPPTSPFNPAPTPRRRAASTTAMESLLQSITRQPVVPEQEFHLVIVPDSGSPSVEQFSTVESLIARINVFLNTNTFIYPFIGTRLGISKAPHRYLTTPFGTLPLFSIPPANELEIEVDGFVGSERIEFVIPDEPVQPAETSLPANQSGPAVSSPSQYPDDDDSVVAPVGG